MDLSDGSKHSSKQQSYDALAKEIFDAFRKSKQTQSRMSGI